MPTHFSFRFSSSLFHLLLLVIVVMMASCAAPPPPGKHVFILSGQSNMTNLDVDKYVTPILANEFGKDNIIVVKYAVGGQSILRWYKDWQPATKAQKRVTGDIYDTLMAQVKPAIANQRIASVTFIWMQGESDAYSTFYSAVYEKSLYGLYAQLQTDLNYPNINWVIGRISDYGEHHHDFHQWAQIRDIQVKVASSNPRFAWINTDDLNDGTPPRAHDKLDFLHYTKDGYATLGKRFAESAIQLIKKNP